jgi:hypothetical protein
MPLPASFRAPIAEIVDALVREDYAALDADGRSGAVGADGLRRAVADYGRSLVELPDAAYKLSDAGHLTGRPGEWWIVVPMWTAEEGRSDLTLELNATPAHDGHRFTVTDLHVL